MPDELIQSVPTFALVFFRLAGMAVSAPLLGGSRLPRRVRAVMTLVLAFGMVQGVTPPAQAPQTPWQWSAGVAGELAFGVVMGMSMNLVFVGVRWAGDIIGQQVGFGLGGVFDPQGGGGGGGSLVGDLYFVLALAVFLTVGGHHAMLRAVRDSFDALPLMSIALERPLLDTMLGLLQACTALALQLAAPLLVTLLVVDLVLGLIGRVLPGLNVMSAALTVRAAVGMVVVIAGLALTTGTVRRAVLDSMEDVRAGWTP